MATGDPDLEADRLVVHYAQAAALVFGTLELKYHLSRLRTAIRAVTPDAKALLTKM